MARFSHLHLTVSDLERSVAFYQGVLGFRVGFRDDTMIEFEDVGLVLDRSDKDQVPESDVMVAFDVDDVDALYDALRERGVAVEEPPRDQPWGVRNFHVRDPDGYSIEFEQPRPRGRRED